ncbi:MAG TPA: AsmA-like C-terminal region-containing protein [Oligoflexia bacterium]|nr:AsmA-like C-terminal region-containing protein [Oligoflexia bacterium]HMR24183.1 AsmA-like C-terminal region-containing protein [Oligoflexia bacterium]
MKKNIGLKIFLGVGVFFLLLYAVLWFMPKKGLITKIEQQVYEATHLQLSIGNISPALFGVSLDNVSLQAEDKEKLFLSLDHAKFKIKLLPLFSKRVVFSKIILDTPQIKYDLAFNYEGPEQSQEQDPSIEDNAIDFELSKVQISNMKVELQEEGSSLFKTQLDRQIYAIKTQGLNVFEISGQAQFKELLYQTAYGYFGRSLEPMLDIDIVYDSKKQSATIKQLALESKSIKADMSGTLNMLNEPHYNIKLNAKSEQLKQILAFLPSKMFSDQSMQSSDGKLMFEASYVGGDDYSKADFMAKLKLTEGVARYGKEIKDIVLDLDVDKQSITLHALKAKTDKSMIDMKAKISNYLNGIDKSPVNVSGQYNLDFDELKQIEMYPPEHTLSGKANGQFNISQSINSPLMSGRHQLIDVAYASTSPDMQNYKIKNVQAKLELEKNLIKIDVDNMQLNNDELSIKGNVRDALNYALADGSLGYDITVNAKSLDLDKLLPDDEEESTEAIDFSPIKKVNGTSRLMCNVLRYSDLDLKNVNAELVTQNGTIDLKNLSANAFSGLLKTNFKLDVSGKDKFPYQANVNVDQVKIDEFLDYAKTFFPIKIDKLTKVGGQLFSQINSSGTINAKTLMPEIDSISFEGPVKIVEGYLKQSTIQKKLASFIKKDSLKSIDFKSWSQYIKFNKGMFEVNKLNFNSQGVDVSGNGTQSLSGKVNYDFNLKLPKNDVEKIAPAIAKLSPNSTSLDLPIKISGSLSDLKIGLAQGDLKKSVTEKAEKKIEQKVEKRVEKKKEEVKKKAKDAVKDKLKGLGL